MEPWQVTEKLKKNPITVGRLLREMLGSRLQKDLQGRYYPTTVNAMNGSERMNAVNSMNTMNGMEEMEMSIL